MGLRYTGYGSTSINSAIKSTNKAIKSSKEGLTGCFFPRVIDVVPPTDLPHLAACGIAVIGKAAVQEKFEQKKASIARTTDETGMKIFLSQMTFSTLAKQSLSKASQIPKRTAQGAASLVQSAHTAGSIAIAGVDHAIKNPDLAIRASKYAAHAAIGAAQSGAKSVAKSAKMLGEGLNKRSINLKNSIKMSLKRADRTIDRNIKNAEDTFGAVGNVVGFGIYATS